MTLFAHRFLALSDSHADVAPGRFDEALGLRVGPDGAPVVSAVGPNTTRGDKDAPAAVDPTTFTNGGKDPGSMVALGPIRTAASRDDDRRAAARHQPR
jgi:hypothetical protein